MKRTQLYLDDGVMERLKVLSRKQGVTVSHLVRDAIDRTYIQPGPPPNWRELYKQAVGSWNRPDAPDPDEFIRKLRSRADRSDRWS